MRAIGLGVIALASCRSAAPVAPVANHTPSAAVVAATPPWTFDGLFRADARWKFHVTTSSEYYDTEDPDANLNGVVRSSDTVDATCWVAATSHFPGGRASEIKCDEDADWRLRDRIYGVWVQTKDGLWRDEELPAEGAAPTLALEARFLASPVVAGQTDTSEPDTGDGPVGGSGSNITITAEKGGWCVAQAWWGGDESWETLCLDEVGPVSGGTGEDGAESHDVTFERAE